MKIVINTCYGGFALSDDMLKELGTDKVFTHDRTDPKLIEIVEAKPNNRVEDDDNCTELRVITLPDDVTDFIITNYDGNEKIVFVRNGKLYQAYWDHYDGCQILLTAGGETVY